MESLGICLADGVLYAKSILIWKKVIIFVRSYAEYPPFLLRMGDFLSFTATMENRKKLQNSSKNDLMRVFVRKFFLNKYFITVFLFFVWMVFFDRTSFLVIYDLNSEISKRRTMLDYYKSEYAKNLSLYERLIKNKSEKEKYARENYFMKKKNEEIFILVSKDEGKKR